uniref:Asialoglycoprotein receptor 2 n=1 Tax=Balaenoptera musculus TaxID=9771 RepID=A0A8C0E2U0_BALMU
MTLALQLPCLRCPSRPDTPSLAGTPPPQPFVLQRLCSKLRLSLLVLGFNILLLVAVCVMGSHSKGHRDPKGNFQQLLLEHLDEILALSSHGDPGRWAHPLPTPLSSLWPLDHATLLLHLKHFPVDMRTLACQLAFLQSNGRDRAGMLPGERPWPEAEKYCIQGTRNFPLPVFQKFIAQHTNPFQTWIGLTDSDGSWRWVDGTDYRHNYKNWAATQPDDWQGHELGGSEDCAEIRGDGRWNDDFCQQVKRWVCEIKRNITI